MGIFFSGIMLSSLFSRILSSIIYWPVLLGIKNLLLFFLLCSSGIIPSVAKLSSGQAAYHFLAGYQNGKFFPAYSKFAYIDALELAKAFMSKVNYQNQCLNQLSFVLSVHVN